MSALLSMKELGDALGRSRDYVSGMKSQGFPMAGGKATLAEARLWLTMKESTGIPFRCRPRRRINRIRG